VKNQKKENPSFKFSYIVPDRLFRSHHPNGLIIFSVMRHQISVLNIPFFLLLLGFFMSCQTDNEKGALESLEQNYRQLRQVNRDAEVITADFIRNLRDSIETTFGDTSLLVQDSIELRLFQGRLDTIEQSSFVMLDQLDLHLKAMEKIITTNPETGRLEAKGEEDESYLYWDPQKAEAIKQAMIAFEGSMVRYSGDSEIRVKEIYDNGLWTQFSMRRPLLAYLSLLEGLKVATHTYQRRSLQALFGQFGTPYFRSDNLVLLNQKSAQVVTAGMPFSSKISVGLEMNRVKSRFSGIGVVPDEDSVSAALQVGADGSLIPNGKSTAIQTYKALVQVPRADSGYIDMLLEDSFTVVRPVVDIRSAGAQLLYRRCENDLSIDVPALESVFRPMIAASEAKVSLVQGTQNDYKIVPNGDSTRITASTGLCDYSILKDQNFYSDIQSHQAIATEY